MFEFKEGCVYIDTLSAKYPAYSWGDRYQCVRRTPKTISIKSLKGFDCGTIYKQQKIRYDRDGNEFIWICSRPHLSNEIAAKNLIEE